jgi:hypothetical protein
VKSTEPTKPPDLEDRDNHADQLLANTSEVDPQHDSTTRSLRSLPMRAVPALGSTSRVRNPGLGPPPNASLVPHRPAPPPPHHRGYLMLERRAHRSGIHRDQWNLDRGTPTATSPAKQAASDVILAPSRGSYSDLRPFRGSLRTPARPLPLPSLPSAIHATPETPSRIPLPLSSPAQPESAGTTLPILGDGSSTATTSMRNLLGASLLTSASPALPSQLPMTPPVTDSLDPGRLPMPERPTRRGTPQARSSGSNLNPDSAPVIPGVQNQTVTASIPASAAVGENAATGEGGAPEGDDATEEDDDADLFVPHIPHGGANPSRSCVDIQQDFDKQVTAARQATLGAGADAGWTDIRGIFTFSDQGSDAAERRTNGNTSHDGRNFNDCPLNIGNEDVSSSQNGDGTGDGNGDGNRSGDRDDGDGEVQKDKKA